MNHLFAIRLVRECCRLIGLQPLPTSCLRVQPSTSGNVLTQDLTPSVPKRYKNNEEESMRHTLNALSLGLVAAFAAPSHAGGLFQPYVSTPTGSWPEAVAIGDVNGDGLNDVVMTTSYYFDPAHDYKLFVFLQNPDGTLAVPAIHATRGTPKSVAIADMDGDGLADVIVGNNGLGIEVFKQGVPGILDSSTFYSTPYSDKIRAADLNNDGLMDVVGIDWGSNFAGVMLGNASGTLSTAVTYTAPHGGYNDLEVGDINGDGLSDIVVMSGQLYSSYPNLSVLTQLAGGFSPVASYNVGSNTSGVGVGDVDGDGKSDVVVSYGGNKPNASIGLFLQNGSGTLTSPPTSLTSYDIPESVDVADVNLDGKQDVIVLHGGWTAAGVYLQQADGSLAPEDLYSIPYASHYNTHGLAIGDINNDGRPDIAIADYNSGLVILYGSNNQAPQAFDQNVVAKEDTSASVTLDATDPDGNALAYVIVQTPANGSLSGLAPNLTYAPKPNFNGTDSFTFKVNDGLADSNVATVSIMVGAVNDVPAAYADKSSTTMDYPVTISVLANDIDPDGDALIVSGIGKPRNGSAKISADKSRIRYVPKLGFTGTDRFAYTASDGKGGTASAIVTVSVTAP